MARTGLVLVALALLVLVTACDPGGGKVTPRQNPDEVAAQQDYERGMAAFRQAGCAKCHVVEAKPMVLEGPDLTYYAYRPVSGSGAVRYRLDPSQPRPAKNPAHPTVAESATRDLLARFLGKGCKLDGYRKPGGEVPSNEIATCPVTGLKLNIRTPGTAWRNHAGRRYYFPNEVTAQKFDMNPGHFTK